MRPEMAQRLFTNKNVLTKVYNENKTGKIFLAP